MTNQYTESITSYLDTVVGNATKMVELLLEVESTQPLTRPE